MKHQTHRRAKFQKFGVFRKDKRNSKYLKVVHLYLDKNRYNN